MAMLKTANLFRYSQIHSKYVKLTLRKYINNNAFTSLQKIANFMQSFYMLLFCLIIRKVLQNINIQKVCLKFRWQNIDNRWLSYFRNKRI